MVRLGDCVLVGLEDDLGPVGVLARRARRMRMSREKAVKEEIVCSQSPNRLSGTKVGSVAFSTMSPTCMGVAIIVRSSEQGQCGHWLGMGTSY